MKYFLLPILILNAFLTFAQETTVQDGDWQDGTTWADGTSPGTTNLGAGRTPITVDHKVTVGSYANQVGLDFAASNKQANFTSTDTLIIYGDVLFEQDALNFIIPSGTVIITGDLTIESKLEISSEGTLVVMGTFSMNGNNTNNLDYSGGGTVYAGGYAGYAEQVIPGDNNNSDQQQTLEDLDTDVADDPALQDIVDFVNNDGVVPLPIVLQSFDGQAGNTSISLTWTTLSEENFDYFEILRADASGHFELVATIPGHGNSTQPVNYQWSDESPLTGYNYYRLESVDFDGYRETFRSILVVFQPREQSFKIYPNPAKANSTLTIGPIPGKTLKAELYSLDGKKHFQWQGLDHSFRLPAFIPGGAYIIRLDINGLVVTQRLNIE